MRNKQNLLYVLLIVVILLLFNFQVLAGKVTYIWGRDDNALLSMPWMYFLKENIVNFKNILWSVGIFNGFPIYAEPSTGMFYPLNILLSLCLPFILAFNFSFLIHNIIAIVSFYYFCRLIKISPIGSFVSAFIFIFGGFYVNIAFDATFLKSVSLIPLFLIVTEKYVTSKNKSIYIIVGSFIWALQWLSGSPQFAVITLILVLLYLILRLFVIENSTVRIAKLFFYFCLTFIIGLLLSAIQILPSYELLSQSIRSEGLEISQATIGSLNPISFISILIPNFFHGDLARIGANVYFGFIPIIFIFLSIKLIKTNRFIGIFWALLAIGIFLSLGSFNPVYNLLVEIPPFSFLRVPSRFFLITSISFAVLAGFGLDYLLINWESENKTISKIYLFIVSLISIILAGNIFVNIFYNPILLTAKNLIKSKIYQKGPHMFELSYYNEVTKNILDNLIDSSSLTNPNIILILIIIIVSFICFIRFRKVKLLMAILIIDLIMVSYFRGLIPPEFKTNLINKKSSSISWLKEDKSLFRIYSWPLYKISTDVFSNKENEVFTVSKNTLQANLNLINGIDSIDGYSGLFPKRQKRILELLEGRASFLNEEQKINKMINSNDILSLMNVKYIVLPNKNIADINIDKININKNIYDIKKMDSLILINKKVLPRTFIVDNYTIAKNENDSFNKIVENKINFSKTVLLEESSNIMNKYTKLNKAVKSRITNYQPNEITIKAYSDKPSFLVVSDSYYPGWLATVNGKSAKILRANYLFRAVKINKGLNIIKFEYKPTLLYLGIKISLISAIIAVIFLIALLTLSKENSTSIANKK